MPGGGGSGVATKLVGHTLLKPIRSRARTLRQGKPLRLRSPHTVAREQLPLAATPLSLHTAMKTQHNQTQQINN